jgi:hypothetical protein
VPQVKRANWERWRHRRSAKLWQVVQLFFGFEPGSLDIDFHRFPVEADYIDLSEYQEFHQRQALNQLIEIAADHMKSGDLPGTPRDVDLAVFANWAETLKLDPELFPRWDPDQFRNAFCRETSAVSNSPKLVAGNDARGTAGEPDVAEAADKQISNALPGIKVPAAGAGHPPSEEIDTGDGVSTGKKTVVPEDRRLEWKIPLERWLSAQKLETLLAFGIPRDAVKAFRRYCENSNPNLVKYLPKRPRGAILEVAKNHLERIRQSTEPEGG